jgi:hypothetical protein
MGNNRRFDRLDIILDVTRQRQGDFQFSIREGYGMMTLRTTDSLGNTMHYLTAWDFRWKECIRALVKIQRFFLSRKLGKVGSNPNQDVFKIKPIAQFKKSKLFPLDIIYYIMDIYFYLK